MLGLGVQQSDPGFLDNSSGKESACNAEGPSSIPGSGRSTGEGIGYPLQYSGLENSMDSVVHGVTKSQTRLSDFHFQSDSDVHMSIYIPFQIIFHYRLLHAVEHINSSLCYRVRPGYLSIL